MKFSLFAILSLVLASCTRPQPWPSEVDVRSDLTLPLQPKELTIAKWTHLAGHEKSIYLHLAAAKKQKLELPPRLLKVDSQSRDDINLSLLNYRMSQGDREAEALLRSHYANPKLRLDILCWAAGFIENREITQDFIDRALAGEFGSTEGAPEINYYEPIWNYLYGDRHH